MRHRNPGLVPCAIVALLAVPALVSAQSPAPPTVTVVDFDIGRTGWVPPPQFGATVAELLADQLVSSGLYRVLDGRWLADPATADRRPSLEALRASAERAGVQYLIAGSVTRFSTETKRRTIGGGFVLPVLGLSRRNKTESVIGLTMRIIDVRTGEVVATAVSQGVGSRKNVTLGAAGAVSRSAALIGMATSALGSREAMIDEALQQAIAVAGKAIAAAAPRLTRTAPDSHDSQGVKRSRGLAS